MKKFYLFLVLVMAAQMSFAQIESSTSLQAYYATANGTYGDALRLTLQDAIKIHNEIGYKQLGTIMQWADTKDADGIHIVDIYTNCNYTCSGPVTWISSGNVGDGMNREHTVPQSWFNKNAPMVSDAFHIYPTDAKANNNRSSYLYGECPNGSSSSTGKCDETGKLGESAWQAGSTSYTYNNQTYVATVSYSGKVYEPDDEFKGDIARSYFYMATRYADKCANWSGGAFGSDRNGLDAYTAELMLKWHRLDPVSEKELIRNEVIFGNPLFNKCDKKQGNRNPFIDFPELVEYIWGDLQDVPVSVTSLDSPYANEEPQGVEYIPTDNAPARKLLINGQIYIILNDQLFNLQGQRVR